MGHSSRIVIVTKKEIDGTSQDVTWSHPFTNPAHEEFIITNAKSWVEYWLKKMQNHYASDLWDIAGSEITLQTNYIPDGGACTKLPKWLQGKNGVSFTL